MSRGPIDAYAGPSVTEKHLADAEASVTRGQMRLAEQRKILEELTAASRDVDLATTVLQLLDENQRLLVAHRDRLQAELTKLGVTAICIIVAGLSMRR